jgi:hypothetical protein
MNDLQKEIMRVLDLHELDKPIYANPGADGISRAEIMESLPTSIGPAGELAAEEVTRTMGLSREEQEAEMRAQVPALKGAATGAAVATATTIPDIIGLGYGGVKALLAKEGEKGQAFLDGLSSISGKYGSELAGEMYAEHVGKLDVSDEEKAAMMTGYQAGEFGGIPGLAGAYQLVKKGVKAAPDFIEGAGDAAKARMEGGTTLTSGANPDPLIAAAGDAVKAMRSKPLSEEKLISQRLPTGATATEDPVATKLVTDTSVTLQQPEAKLTANFQKVAAYPNMQEGFESLEPKAAAEVLKEHVVQNLLYLHDKVPEATRQRSKMWYDGANKISQDYADKYNLPLESVAGAMAALSPQKDWYQNADLGRRVIETINSVTKGNEKGMVMDKKMTKVMKQKFNANKPKDKSIMDAIIGKSFSDLELPAEKAMWLRVYDETYNERNYPIVNPEGTFGDTVKTGKGQNRKVAWGSLNEIGKAITAIESGGDLKILSDAMGEQNKVRNFYNNIYNPASTNGDVTIDTHAIAAGLMRPLAGDATEVHHNFGSAPDAKKRDSLWAGGVSNTNVTGVKGLYGIYADAYRDAAKQRGVLPREMQSITWEAVRGLYTDVSKRDKQFVEDVNNIWYKYKKGEINLQEAQDAAIERGGGIDKPSWED